MGNKIDPLSAPRDDELEQIRTQLHALIGDQIKKADPDASLTVLGAGRDDVEPGRNFLSVLDQGGWSVPNWPVEYGGRGVAPSEVALISRTLFDFEQPDLYPFLVSLHVVGPALIEYASTEQKTRWLPAIRSGKEIWCQLFSEPGAGSDLANVSTRAVRDGDGWLVTGQKVWTSRAHYSRWGLLLARTDADVTKHAGITAFAVDMAAKGVDVRSLIQMNGDAHFSEVFLDEVFVPDVDRIAEPGQGWAIARSALAHERGAISATNTGMGIPIDRLTDLAKTSGPVRRDAAMSVYLESEVARLTARRARSGSSDLGPTGSAAKLRGSAVFKHTANCGLGILGMASIASEDKTDTEPDQEDEPSVSEDWGTLFLTSPSISIRGGTDEIQRNIVGERGLGLPPEPRVDRDKSFRDQV